MSNEIIEEVIQSEESETVAFAPAGDANNVARVGRIICSFANGNGGVVVIGGAKGTVSYDPTLMDSLKGSLLERLAPAISFTIRPVSSQGRSLLLVDVPSGWEIPYTFDREIFVRNGKKSEQADGLAVRALLEKKASLGLRWERQIAVGATLHDLDATLLMQIATEAEGGKRFFSGGRKSAIEILRELDLAEANLLRNSSYALLGKNSDRRFPQIRVRAIAYRGTDQESLKDSQMIGGNLYEILDKGLTFLRENSPISSEIPKEGLQRKQRAPYPLVAVREALLNAIIHRDYAAFDGSVSISIFTDRVEIWNIGGLPAGMEISELSQVHASRPRNPDIAHLFMVHGYIERIGSGTRRIIREFTEAGLPTPVWRNVSGGILLILPREKLAGAVASDQDLNPRQRAVLKSLQVEEAIRIADYLARSPEKIKERQARDDLKSLVTMGFMRRRGQARQTEYLRTEKPLE